MLNRAIQTGHWSQRAQVKIMKFYTILGLALLLLLVPALLIGLLFVKPAKTGLDFERVSFTDLPGWNGEQVFAAVPALRQSCEKLKTLPAQRNLPGAAIGGTAEDWSDGCAAILAATTKQALTNALTDHFNPLKVSLGGNSDGKFTGYYETLLRGSRTQSEHYNVPLHMRPPELVMVDLGAFRSDLAGRRIAGRVDGGRLLPYPDRRKIDGGHLDGRNLELLWVDSAVDAFFLHIQGSGRVRMPDGSLLRVGYAAQNGHTYSAIGRFLISEGEIAPENMSMQSIRQWLKNNPDKVTDMLHRNSSYIFFRELGDGPGPIGSANVPLTAGHSLAVDRKHLPLHAPVWLASSYPDPKSRTAPPIPFNRLMVAQDTGGAITGEIRGDVFWGFGDQAEEIAGRMANRGSYWLILPKALAITADGDGE